MRLLRRDTSPPQAQERSDNGTAAAQPSDSANETAASQPTDAPPEVTQSGEVIPPVRDLEGGPDNPLELGKTGWRNTFQRAVKKYSKDRCSMAAGSLAYHWFLALFPALIALLGFVSLVNLDPSQVDHLVNGLSKALPGSAAQVFNTAVTLRAEPQNRFRGYGDRRHRRGRVERLRRHGSPGNRARRRL